MRKYYWYISTFFRKHGAIVLISVIVALVIFSLALPFVISMVTFSPKVYIGVVGRPTLASLPKEIQQEISLGLTTVDEDGSAMPGLAERWLVEDDGKTYRFLLKKKQLWHDGTEVTPTDVTYTFSGAKIVRNANEVIFKLEEPYAPFPVVVSQPLFRIIEERYAGIFHRQRLVGTGPYQVLDYKLRGNRVTELRLTSPTEEKIYRFYLTEEDAIGGFIRGEVDVLPNFSSAGELAMWDSVNMSKSLDQQSVLGVFFHVKFPAFSKEVRQALNYAAIKPEAETRVAGPISPTSWAFSNIGKTYEYDLDRAVERLLSNIPGEPIHFTLTTTPLFTSTALALESSWEQLGQTAVAACTQRKEIKDKSVCANLSIQVELRLTNFPDVTNFEALLVGQTLPIDPDQYALWHSNQQTNFTQYSNVRIDSLLEKGRQLTDQKERRKVYQDFQQFFSDDQPVIFLEYLYRYTITRK